MKIVLVAALAAVLAIGVGAGAVGQGIGTAEYELQYAREYLKAGDYDLAAMRARQALALDPGNGEAKALIEDAEAKARAKAEARASASRSTAALRSSATSRRGAQAANSCQGAFAVCWTAANRAGDYARQNACFTQRNQCEARSSR